MIKDPVDWFLLATAIFLNLWIWQLFSSDLILGVLVCATTVSFYLALKKVKFSRLALIIFLSLTLFFQWKATPKTDYFTLSNDEQRIQQVRLKEYSLIYIRTLGRHFWFSPGEYFEENKNFLALSRFLRNFFENLDLNVYFFGGHPRERVWAKDFEKFSFLFVPFFLIGLVRLLRKSSSWLLLLVFFLPLLLSSFWGNSPLGPFSLFPFLAGTMVEGIRSSLNWVWQRKKDFKQ